MVQLEFMFFLNLDEYLCEKKKKTTYALKSEHGWNTFMSLTIEIKV
jgi:hypothetical protein